jgi:hypothetical protein
MGEMTKVKLAGLGVAIGIALLLMLEGCGGGSDSGSGSGSATKAEFMAEAKAICNKAEQEREEVTHKLLLEYQEREANANQKQQEEAVLKVLGVYTKTTEALASLDLPEGEEQKVEAILTAREDAAAQVQSSPSSALNNGAPFQKPDQLAKAYGLEGCAI